MVCAVHVVLLEEDFWLVIHYSRDYCYHYLRRYYHLFRGWNSFVVKIEPVVDPEHQVNHILSQLGFIKLALNNLGYWDY